MRKILLSSLLCIALVSLVIKGNQRPDALSNVQPLTDLPQEQHPQEKHEPVIEQRQPIVDISEAQDVDYSFFNDPYLFEQYRAQPLVNLTSDSRDGIAPGAAIPIVDPDEARDVDFSYFNDPYAFEKFRRALPIKAKISGYVQHSAWWDSRQVIGLGDDYVLLFPKKREFDVDCKDINARGEFNMIMIETRVRGEFFGPKVLGAETFGYIESDIFGIGLLINRWRARNVFVQFSWPKARVLLGLFWSPAFVVKTFPLTVSFDGGVPIAPFSRNPQIRITAKWGPAKLVLAALSQLQFTSNGPIGFSTTYLRNSRVPILWARLSHERKHFYVGAGVGFLRLKPRLESNKGFKVRESINSARAFAFSTIRFEPLELRSQLTYSQNANDLIMLSGFAVDSVNPTTDERTYTNLSAISYWLDINISAQIEPGLFVGITKNLGARNDIIPCIIDPKTGEEEDTIYALQDDIDNVFRISPRVRLHVLPVDFAAEVEYTRAAYGCIDNRGRVQNTDPVANTRLIFTAYYYF